MAKTILTKKDKVGRHINQIVRLTLYYSNQDSVVLAREGRIWNRTESPETASCKSD